MKQLLLITTTLLSCTLHAQDSTKPYSLHFQSTLIPQYHFDFHSPYSGDNSLLASEPTRASLSGTVFFAWKPAKHTYFVFNPEAAGGKGLSKTLGIAGFPNGEVYRVGDPKPKPFIARLYAEQRFALSNRKEKVEDDENQVAETTDKDYLSILFGKFSLTDFFGNSQVSHDPRTQFMNWSLMGNGGWDYPANTRGYTFGTVLQAFVHDWEFRTALVAMPMEANGAEMQFKFGDAMGWVAEIAKAHVLQRDETHYSSFRVGGFVNKARMGNYQLSIQRSLASSYYPHPAPDIEDSRLYGRSKAGFYINIDNHFGQVHHFIKASWNDGKNETWAFTEIDNSIATGLQFDGSLWKRTADALGIAIVRNGLSADHRNYLALGGYGFLIGDGQLNYAHETATELYYSLALGKHLSLSPDYQWVLNPAYNRDRGPVHILALRMHAEF